MKMRYLGSVSKETKGVFPGTNESLITPNERP